eukprot:tig00021037_g17446.t1
MQRLVPGRIAEEIAAGKRIVAHDVPECALLCVDLTGFAAYTAQNVASPEKIVGLINRVVAICDRLVKEHGAHKIDAVADRYIVASSSHLVSDAPGSGSRRRRPSDEADASDGDGAASEASGYHLFGETFFVASRLLASCPPGELLASERAQRLVGDEAYACDGKRMVHVQARRARVPAVLLKRRPPGETPPLLSARLRAGSRAASRGLILTAPIQPYVPPPEAVAASQAALRGAEGAAQQPPPREEAEEAEEAEAEAEAAAEPAREPSEPSPPPAHAARAIYAPIFEPLLDGFEFGPDGARRASASAGARRTSSTGSVARRRLSRRATAGGGVDSEEGAPLLQLAPPQPPPPPPGRLAPLAIEHAAAAPLPPRAAPARLAPASPAGARGARAPSARRPQRGRVRDGAHAGAIPPLPRPAPARSAIRAPSPAPPSPSEPLNAVPPAPEPYPVAERALAPLRRGLRAARRLLGAFSLARIMTPIEGVSVRPPGFGDGAGRARTNSVSSVESESSWGTGAGSGLLSIPDQQQAPVPRAPTSRMFTARPSLISTWSAAASTTPLDLLVRAAAALQPARSPSGSLESAPSFGGALPTVRTPKSAGGGAGSAAAARSPKASGAGGALGHGQGRPKLASASRRQIKSFLHTGRSSAKDGYENIRRKVQFRFGRLRIDAETLAAFQKPFREHFQRSCLPQLRFILLFLLCANLYMGALFDPRYLLRERALPVRVACRLAAPALPPGIEAVFKYTEVEGLVASGWANVSWAPGSPGRCEYDAGRMFDPPDASLLRASAAGPVHVVEGAHPAGLAEAAPRALWANATAGGVLVQWEGALWPWSHGDPFGETGRPMGFAGPGAFATLAALRLSSPTKDGMYGVVAALDVAALAFSFLRPRAPGVLGALVLAVALHAALFAAVHALAPADIFEASVSVVEFACYVLRLPFPHYAAVTAATAALQFGVALGAPRRFSDALLAGRPVPVPVPGGAPFPRPIDFITGAIRDEIRKSEFRPAPPRLAFLYLAWHTEAAERTQFILRARLRSEERASAGLLGSMLPERVTERLMRGRTFPAESVPDGVVMPALEPDGLGGGEEGGGWRVAGGGRERRADGGGQESINPPPSSARPARPRRFRASPRFPAPRPLTLTRLPPASQVCDVAGVNEIGDARRTAGLLHVLLDSFDSLLASHRLHKVWSLGDVYVVAAGAPLTHEPTKGGREEADGAAVRVANFALEMRHVFRKRVTHVNRPELEMRVGIARSALVGGLVGITLPRYELFGHALSHATRLCAACEPGRIRISDSVREALGDGYAFEEAPHVAPGSAGPSGALFPADEGAGAGAGAPRDAEEEAAAAAAVATYILLSPPPAGAQPAPASEARPSPRAPPPPPEHYLVSSLRGAFDWQWGFLGDLGGGAAGAAGGAGREPLLSGQSRRLSTWTPQRPAAPGPAAQIPSR